MEIILCIPGYFYNLARTSPRLEAVELQDPAHPHLDWNERIGTESHSPDLTAHALGGEGHMVDGGSNHSDIGSNFGPTMLACMVGKENLA